MLCFFNAVAWECFLASRSGQARRTPQATGPHQPWSRWLQAFDAAISVLHTQSKQVQHWNSVPGGEDQLQLSQTGQVGAHLWSFCQLQLLSQSPAEASLFVAKPILDKRILPILVSHDLFHSFGEKLHNMQRCRFSSH